MTGFEWGATSPSSLTWRALSGLRCGRSLSAGRVILTFGFHVLQLWFFSQNSSGDSDGFVVENAFVDRKRGMKWARASLSS